MENLTNIYHDPFQCRLIQTLTHSHSMIVKRVLTHISDI